MKYQFIMPGLIIALSFAAAIVYAWHGDWRRTIYFLAAAVLNITVVW